MKKQLHNAMMAVVQGKHDEATEMFSEYVKEKALSLMNEASEVQPIAQTDTYTVGVDVSDSSYPHVEIGILRDNATVYLMLGLQDVEEESNEPNLSDTIDVDYEIDHEGNDSYTQPLSNINGKISVSVEVDSEGREGDSNKTNDPQNSNPYYFDGWGQVKGYNFDSNIMQALKFVQQRIGTDISADLDKAIRYAINNALKQLMDNYEIDDINFDDGY